MNGFSLDYTCRGRKPRTDSDVYTIAEGGDDGRPLARTGANLRIAKTLTGRITRFSEDGPRRVGTGKLVLDVRAYRSATRIVLRGTARVRSGTCPSADTLALRVSAPR